MSRFQLLEKIFGFIDFVGNRINSTRLGASILRRLFVCEQVNLLVPKICKRGGLVAVICFGQHTNFGK